MEMMDIQYSTYGYTEQWQGVRSDIDATSTARGVIAQNIKAMSILGDRVTIHEDNEIGLTEPGFYQVDKQGLTLDLIAALQAHHDHFNIAPGEAGSSAAVSIRTDADTTSGSISLVTADAGVPSGEGAGGPGNSGEILVQTGRASAGESGSIVLSVGEAGTGPGGAIVLEAGSTASGKAGDVRFKAGGGKQA